MEVRDTKPESVPSSNEMKPMISILIRGEIQVARAAPFIPNSNLKIKM